MKKDIIINSAFTAGMLLMAGWVCAVIAAPFYSAYFFTEKEPIPFKVKERKSGFIQKGWKIWIKEGREGYRNAVKKRSIFAGKIVKERDIYRTGVLLKPDEAVVISGLSSKKHAITVPEETYVHTVHDMEATAYDPSPESNGLDWAGITALGWRTRFGIAAIDPKVISLRRLIYVDGYGFAWTGDTGGDIKGKRIDLCYNTTKEALEWGRRKVKVYVLGTKPPSYYKEKRKSK